MAKLTRVTGKVFGSAAQAQSGGIGQFGSAATGTPNPTTDVATIQALQAYLDGWGSAVITSRNFPPIEEVTGVLKTISYQACYTLQEGIPEYDINTEYSNTSVVKSINNGITTLYVSLANGNIGNPLTDTTKWKSYVLDQIQRNIGEIVTSTIPLTDAGLHLLDGSLLSGAGGYGGFVAYIADLYAADPTANYFTTEADWQQAVSANGVCGKFVYDSVNNTVRLPKVTGFIEGTIDTTTLGDLTEAGLPNIKTSSSVTRGLGIADDSSIDAPFYQINSAIGNEGIGSQITRGVGFDASLIDSIYGNSSTVQPQSVKVLYYIVVATSTKTDIQVDIDEIAADLALKADKDLDNCVTGAFENVVALAQSTGKATVTGWGMPDYANGISVSMPYSSSKFTAPSDGVYVLLGYVPAPSGSARLNINGVETNYGTMNAGGYYDSHDAVTVPLSKGDIIYWTNSIAGSSTFYPLKGAN